MGKKSSNSKSLTILPNGQTLILRQIEVIKKDFHNSIQFISSNRSFFTTAALLAILLQVSSVSSLGASFEKYCGTKKNSGSSMRGGGGEEPKVLTLQDLQSAKAQEKADKKQEKVDEKRQSKIQKASKKIMKKEEDNDT